MYFVFIEGQGYNFGFIATFLPCSVYFKVGVFFFHVEVTALIFPREGVGFAYIITGVSLRIVVAGATCNVTEEYFERNSTSK